MSTNMEIINILKQIKQSYDDQVVSNWQANRFAAAFLMPKDEFINKWNEYEGSINRLAAYFQVPAEEVKKRAAYLNVRIDSNKNVKKKDRKNMRKSNWKIENKPKPYEKYK